MAPTIYFIEKASKSQIQVRICHWFEEACSRARMESSSQLRAFLLHTEPLAALPRPQRHLEVPEGFGWSGTPLPHSASKSRDLAVTEREHQRVEGREAIFLIGDKNINTVALCLMIDTRPSPLNPQPLSNLLYDAVLFFPETLVLICTAASQ